ncbi:MAG: HAD family hydrolase [Ruminococcaceae bacterium]|nr:HAD family hydrolase [Oscillospiraceae bacterium]
MKKTILFDLDGTLTDSGEGIINCVIYALEHYGLPIPSQEELRLFVGPPLPEMFVKYGVKPENAVEAEDIFRERFIPIGMYENKVYPGIEELLQALRSDGHVLCIATSKPERMALTILEHFGLKKYFHYICGATLDHSRDTKEQVIAYLLSQCNSEYPWVMVGDTAFDVIGANAHSIPAIGVAWGYGDVDAMKEAGASAIAYTTQELLQQLSI